jgi:RNA polymerase sigma factor (sigma-70 family)
MHLWLCLRRRMSLRRRPLRVRMPVKQSPAYESAELPGPASAGLVSYGAMKPTRSPTSNAAELDPATPEVLRVLVDNHARFLGFLERRVGSRDVAEDILQEAFVRNLDRVGSIRKTDSAIAWFYRVLRNAIADHFRRQDTRERTLAQVSAETGQQAAAPDEELEAVVCACVIELVDTLKPEYATALRRVDLDEISVRSYAEEAGITAGNAGVRLHRAREALRKQLARCCGTCLTHGCFDCQCKKNGTQTPS